VTRKDGWAAVLYKVVGHRSQVTSHKVIC
jgi:hypothetical protein